MATKKQSQKQAHIQPNIALPLVSLSNDEMSQVSGGTVKLT